MKELRFLLVAACVAAACFMMAGCGGGQSVSQPSGPDVVGTWELSGGTSGGAEISKDQMAQMKELGMSITMKFDADGTLTGAMYDEELTGTWEAVDASTVNMTFSGQTQQGTVANGELTIKLDEGSSMVLSKTS